MAKMIRIARRHWRTVGADCGILRAGEIVDGLVQAADSVAHEAARSLPPDFPREVSDPILDGLTTAARRLGRTG